MLSSGYSALLSPNSEWLLENYILMINHERVLTFFFLFFFYCLLHSKPPWRVFRAPLSHAGFTAFIAFLLFRTEIKKGLWKLTLEKCYFGNEDRRVVFAKHSPGAAIMINGRRWVGTPHQQPILKLNILGEPSPWNPPMTGSNYD